MSELKIVFVAGEKQLTLIVEKQKHIWEIEAKLLARLTDEEREELAGVKFRKYWFDGAENRVDIMNDDDYNIFLRHARGSSVPKMFVEVHNNGLVRVAPVNDLIINMGLVRIDFSVTDILGFPLLLPRMLQLDCTIL